MSPNARLRIRVAHLKEVLDWPNADLVRLILATHSNRGKIPEEAIERYRLPVDLVQQAERVIMLPFKLLGPVPRTMW